MRRAILICGIVAFVPIMRGEAFACTCDESSPTGRIEQTVSEAFADAEAVFAGKVVAIYKRTRPVRVVFIVDRSWKGNVPSRVVISTGRGDGDCGYRFLNGRRYLVYAGHALLTRWGTSICHRTGSLWDRAGDLQVLGDAKRSFGRRAHFLGTKPNKSLDRSGGSVFRIIIRPVVLD
jgi:hypothetical protein